MTKLFITYRYIALLLADRYIALLLAACMLSGCLGGSIAQQIVSSIATRVADRAIANAMDVQDGPSNRKPGSSAYNPYVNSMSSSSNNTSARNTALPNTLPDPYQVAIMNTAFEPVKAISEPLSDSSLQPAEDIEARIAIIEGNQLVRVELFNLLIGEEKNAVYEKARLLGATSLPQKREWQRWGVGTGELKIEGQSDKKVITFLIPPEFGKMPSGSIAMVELASPGELNVARYKGN